MTFLHLTFARSAILCVCRNQGVYIYKWTATWDNVSSDVRLAKTIQNVPSKDSDQTARMRRLIWIFAGRKCPNVRFWTFSAQFTKVRFWTFRLNLRRYVSGRFGSIYDGTSLDVSVQFTKIRFWTLRFNFFYSSVTDLVCSYVPAFIRVICFTICSSSLLLLVPRDHCGSWLGHFCGYLH